MQRLKEYEDTGLEPEQVVELKSFTQGGIHKIDDGWKHVQDLLQAEQDGRLVVLPCKVGDNVWFVRKFGKERCIKRAEVSCINIDCRGEVFVSARRISGGYIGKTVFLTHEEAEAALKGGEG